MKKATGLVLLSVVFGLVGVAGATSVELYSGVDDATLLNGDSTNYGSDTSLTLGQWGSQAVIKFDVSSIPAGSTINSASLHMYCVWTNNSTNVAYYAADASESWVESQVNWSERSTGVNWTTPGGTYNTTMGASWVNVGNTTYSWDVQSAVQNWVNGGANNGLVMLYAGGWGYNPKVFYSSEAGVGSGGPTLAVDYTVPEPVTMGLMLLGGLLLRRRSA